MIKDFNAADVELISDWGWNGSSIFKAATTCYRSEEYTEKTPDDFIRILKNNKHTAMLEFMWIVFYIESYNMDLLNYFHNHKYFKIIETPHGIYVGGNGRCWLEFYQSLSVDTITNTHTLYTLSHISAKLKEVNYELFQNITSLDKYISEVMDCNISILKKNSEIPLIHNELTWYMVKLKNVSRGLTHEVVRHRTMSFAQASTRYINNSNFDMIFPVEDYPDFKEDVHDIYDFIGDVYSRMIKDNKVPKNIARQILPIGLSNEICIAGTLDAWNAMFALRCSPAAHPEIRKVCEIIREKIYANI